MSDDRPKDRKRALKLGIERAARPDRAGPRAKRTLNVARRSNVVAAVHLGEPGGRQVAAAKQTVRIRQRDGETREQVETVETVEAES